MQATKLGNCMLRHYRRHITTSSTRLRGNFGSKIDKQVGNVKDKAALVTGGASGIGLQCCKALLRCGARGVTIADRDNDTGEVALKELAEEFGNDKVVFVNCDVTKSELVDWAFKTTLNAFNRLDIVINNAGVLNDKVWENEIHTNVCGTMVGCLLGLQYMAAHCAGQGGIVINIGSTMGLSPFGGAPIYSMTQSAVLGLTRALGAGSHLDRTKVKVMAIACGLTKTPLMINATKHAINTRFSADFKREMMCHKWQKPEDVAKAVLNAIKDGESGAVWVVESGCDPYKICMPCYRDLMDSGKDTISECSIPGKLKVTSKQTKKGDEEDAKTTVSSKSAAAPPPGKSSKAPGSCGTCPEPKWYDGPPAPPKKKKKEGKKGEKEGKEGKEGKEAKEECHSCDIDLKYKKETKKKKPKKAQAKVSYLGKCAAPTVKTGKPGQAPAKGKAPAKKAPAAAKKPPPAKAKPAKPVPKAAAAKEPPKAKAAPPPKAKGAKPAPAKPAAAKPAAAKPAAAKPSAKGKSQDASDESLSELSFKCKCDEKKAKGKGHKSKNKARVKQ